MLRPKCRISRDKWHVYVELKERVLQGGTLQLVGIRMKSGDKTEEGEARDAEREALVAWSRHGCESKWFDVIEWTSLERGCYPLRRRGYCVACRK